jgi:magnesium transporter
MAPGWIWLHNPDDATIEYLSAETGVDKDFFLDIYDAEEPPRLQREGESLFGIMQVPILTSARDGKQWIPHPMGWVLQRDTLISISTVPFPFLLNIFNETQADQAIVHAPKDLLLRLMQSVTETYQDAIRELQQQLIDLESRLDRTQRNEDLFRLLDVGKSALQLHSALDGNVAAVFKLSRSRQVSWSIEEKISLTLMVADLQAVHERAAILSETSNSSMDAYGGMVQNNINHGLKVITTLALVLYIPALVATMWGINTPRPLSHNPLAFWYLTLGGLAISAALTLIFRYRLRWI